MTVDKVGKVALCIECHEEYDINELTLEGECFDCSTHDNIPPPNKLEMTKQIVAETIERLAKVRDVTADQMKDKLVTEHQVKETIGKKIKISEYKKEKN